MRNDKDELLGSAKINFENLERAIPIVALHPYYRIAKAQLDEALGGPSVEERFALDVKRADKPAMKPFSQSVNLMMCNDFAHVILPDADACQCGKRKRSDIV